SGVLARNLPTSAGPGVGQSVFRIEIGSAGCDRDRLTYHDFAGLDGAGRCWNGKRLIAELEDQTSAQPDSALLRTAEIGETGINLVGKIVGRPYPVCFKQPQREPCPEIEIHSAAENCTNTVAGFNVGHSQTVVAQQGVNEESRSLVAIGEARSDRNRLYRSVVVLVGAVVGFESQEPRKVIGQAGAAALRNIAHLHSYRSAVELEGSRHSDTGMQPLIANEDFHLRGRFILCQGSS